MRKRLGQMEQVKQDAIDYGRYIVDNKATYRSTADNFGVHFTRIARYVKQILPTVDKELSDKVQEVLELNKLEKHTRGGEATYQKFKG